MPGFGDHVVTAAGTAYRLRRAGAGPPLLLLHGYPQTGWCWRRVAPALAAHHDVVVPDLPGYGATPGPPAGGARGEGYAKRETARGLVALMEALGHRRFAVVGHDRGGRVAYRMALDHPERITRLGVLDVIPTLEAFEAMTPEVAHATYHWFFLAQPPPLPERLIGGDPGFFLRHTVRSWSGDAAAFPDAALDHYAAAFTPAVVAASCADYRAGATLDRAHDRADRDAGRRIGVPLLVLWGGRPGRGGTDMTAVWRRWATDVRGRELACGHFIPEEAPEALLAELTPFLRGR